MNLSANILSGRITERLSLITLSCLLFFMSQQASAAWTILNPQPVAGDIIKVDFIDNENGFILTDGGIVMKTVDGGADWIEMNNPSAITGVFDIDFITPEVGWVLCGNDPDDRNLQFIDFTSNGGIVWDTYSVGNDETPAMLNCLKFLNDMHGWVGGETIFEGNSRFVIFRFVNGDFWETTILPEGPGSRLNDIFFLNGSLGWVVGESGYSAYTMNGGQEWFISDLVTNDNLYSVHFSDTMDGWAVGGGFNRGVILRSNDGGESWSILENHPVPSRLRGVFAIDSRRAYAISEGTDRFAGQVFFTSDAENWSQTAAFQDKLLLCMSNIEHNIWMGANNGYLATSADGVNWNELFETIYARDFYDIQFFGQIGYVSGDLGRMYKSFDSGQTWNRVETGANWRILNMHFNNPSEGFITGANSTERYTEDGGESWEEVNISDVDVNLIAFNGGYGYATHEQSIAVTHDSGQNWASSEVILGGVPASAISVPDVDIAYIASAGDTLRRTLDGGENWEAVRGLMGESFGVSFINAETGWAIAPTQGRGIRLFKTTDSGDSWTSGYRFELAPGGVLFTDEDNGWIWENPGHILCTENGGQTWEDSYLRVNRIIRSLYAESYQRLWICGDDGLIATWSRNEVSVPIFPETQPTGFTITPLYPNPTNSTVNLSISITRPGDYNIILLDLTGRTLKTSQMSFSAGGIYPVSMDLDGLAAGVYWVGFGDGGVGVGRMVVLVR